MNEPFLTKKRMRRIADVGAAVAAAVALAGVALATIPDAGVISACYQKSGILRVIDAATGDMREE